MAQNGLIRFPALKEVPLYRAHHHLPISAVLETFGPTIGACDHSFSKRVLSTIILCIKSIWRSRHFKASGPVGVTVIYQATHHEIPNYKSQWTQEYKAQRDRGKPHHEGWPWSGRGLGAPRSSLWTKALHSISREHIFIEIRCVCSFKNRVLEPGGQYWSRLRPTLWT